MKIDRLLGIVVYLLNRDVVSARILADKFEVSQRTIQRDIESINLAGIPIISLAGANGGYKILDSFKLNNQISNSDDYMFILTALKGLGSAYDNRKLDLTLEKILHTSIHNNELQQKLFLDFTVVREDPNTSPLIKLIESAIDEKRAVSFDYTNADNYPTHPLVEPIALTYKWYAWYLLGYCTERQKYRLYKLHRIKNLEKTQIPFATTHQSGDVLLAEQEKNDSRRYYRIKLLCKKDARIQVSEYLKGQIVEELNNGDCILSMHVPANERMWFSLLLGFGDQITVIEPDELRIRLADKAKEILNLYHE